MSKESKTALMSGGATGIGRASVEVFLENGWSVGVVDSDEEGVRDLRNNANVEVSVCDVANVGDLRDGVQKLADKLGEFDAVFANAGFHEHNSVRDVTETAWDRMMEVNLKGQVFLIQCALPNMSTRGNRAIVLMGSDQTFIGKTRSLAYGATKGGVGQVTKNMALDLAEDDIRVNCVCPGTIDTPLARQAMRDWAERELDGDMNEALRLEGERFPLGRVGSAREVADVVFFLCSEAASFITGALIPIDGGYTAQ